MKLEDAIRDLEGRQSADSNRPVKVELRLDDSQSGAPSRFSIVRFNAKMSDSAVQLSFKDLESAIRGLQQYVLDSTAPPESAAETMGPLQQMLNTHLPDQSSPTARWMWADAGWQVMLPALRVVDTNDPTNWSEWYGLDDAILDVEAYGLVASQQLERPVILQIKIDSPQCALRYEEKNETAAAATQRLRGIIEATTLLKGRDDMAKEVGPDDAEAKYQEYALSTMQQNGDCAGAAVRFSGFSTPETYPCIQNGQQGIIQRFENLGNVLVNWGMHTTSVSMQYCELIATADRRLHLAGISADDVLSDFLRVVKDNLREVSTDPAAFEQAFGRLVECCKDPGCNYRAAELDMCVTVVETMNKNMEQEGRPTRGLLYTCCLVLWWIVHPRVGSPGPIKSKTILDAVERKQKKLAEAAKEKAMEANACEALARACEAFPSDAELKAAAGDIVRYLVKDNEERREKVLAAGWKQEWL